MLAALISIPLSLSALWAAEQSAEATTPQIDYSAQITQGLLTVSDPGANSILDPGTTKTIEAWIRPSSIPNDSSDDVILQKAYSYALALNNGKIRYYTGANGSNGTDWTVARVGDPTLVANRWYHLALVIVSGNVFLFIDGVQVNVSTDGSNSFTEALAYSSDSQNNERLTVGSWPNMSGRFLGEIDQVKLWNADRRTTLPQDMHAWQSSNSTLPVAHWDFNAGTGTTVTAQLGSLNLTNSTSNSMTYTDVKQVTYPSNGRTVVTFPRSYLTASGGWAFPSGISRADLLIVGGGGGGGSRHAGGGGAGALLYQQSTNLSGTLKVQVGQGGKGNLRITDHNGQLAGGSGQSSFLGTTELKGGGGGAGAAGPAQAGGSGGGMNGAADSPAQATGTGLFNRGGRGDGDAGGNYAGGGGGGAQSAGFNAARPVAGAGGSGYVSNISGSLACYAAGGGGGSETNTGGTTGGAAGAGGACTSGQVSSTVATTAGAGSRGNAAASSAAPNTGSGGGGGGYHTTLVRSGESGFGGSGIVIVSYAGQDLAWSKSSLEQNYASSLTQVVPATGAWTVEMWMKPDATMISTNGTWYGIFSQMNDGDDFTQRASLWMRNGKLHYSNGGSGSGDLTGYTFSESRWYHLAMSSDTNSIKIFIDGTEVQSATLAKGTIGPRFTIGGARQHYSGLMEFAGHMDQVKVWGGALSAAQLTQSMHTHSTVGITSPPELRAHYDFNEFVTGQVLDRSGNNQHLAFNTGVAGSYASTNFTDSEIVSSSVSSTNRVFQFNRSYLNADGGWLAPNTSVSYRALIVGGGGGGGKPGNPAFLTGGTGAGGAVYHIPSLSLPSAPVPILVGHGGIGGRLGTDQGSNGGDSVLGTLRVGGGGGGNSFQYTGARLVTPGGAGYVAGGNGGGGRQESGASSASYALGGLGGVAASQVFNGVTYSALTGVAGSNDDSSDSGTGGIGGKSVSRTFDISGASVEYGKAPNWYAYPGSGNGEQTLGSGGATNYAPNTGLSTDVGGSGRSGVVFLSYQVTPDAPSSLSATSGSLASLAWSPPSYTGEGSITDYVVQYRESPSGSWTTFSDGTSTATSVNVTGLTACKKYDFQVAAKNAIGTSSYSSASSAIVGAGTFGSVDGVTPVISGSRCVLNFTKVGATTWTPPSGTNTGDLMAVGGGAGGRGDGGGGGGGGSAQHSSGVTITDKAFTMTVGAGGASDVAGSPSTISASGISFSANGGRLGGEFVTRTAGLAGASGTGGTYIAGGSGGAGPATTDHNIPGVSNGSAGLTSPIAGSLFTKYGGGGGGGASSHSSSFANKTTAASPKLGVDGGGDGGGVGPQSSTYICSGRSGNASFFGASAGQPGVDGQGGGGGAGVAYGDECAGTPNTSNDGERTRGGTGGSGAIVVSFAIPGAVPLASAALCNGTSTQNSLTVESGHGEVFYIDTGQGQNIDAAYIAYRVNSTSARSDLWVEVTGFTGGSVSLANVNDSALPLGTVTANGTKTAFFMIKAKNATTTAQSHVVNVYDTKPTIGNPTPIYTCNYTFTAVEETIKAAANKVDSVTSTSVAQLGATMTITVDGDSGTIGQGNAIDGRMIWLTPAARSNWPTGALRLESTTLTTFSNSARTNVITTHTDTLRINATTSPALASTNRQYYRAVYTFRVIGAAAASAPIIPIAMISSGTQIKHTDVAGISGGSVDVTAPAVNLTVTKNVSPVTTVNSDGTTSFDYTVTLVNGGNQTLVIDEVIDTPDAALTYKSGTAKFNAATIEDPGKVGTTQLGFSGPMSLPANTQRTITYKMVGETCAVGSTYNYVNTATARTGTVVIGSGSATQSVVNIRGNCGEPEAVVEVKNEPIPPSATTAAASSVTTSGATISGVVDPNGETGLNIRFVYGTSATLSSTTAVNLSNSTASSSGYGVTTSLTGLSGGTTYYYRVEIKDKAGNWVQGEIMSFTTSPAPANPTAETSAVSEITTTTAQFNGAVDANLVTGGSKVSYEWGLANSDGTCTGSEPTSIQSSGFLQSEGASSSEDAILTGSAPATMTFSATGLSDGTKYCVRINGHYGTGFNTKVSGSWVPFTLTAKSPQTITFASSFSSLAAGGTTTVNASSSSGLTISYTSTDTSICTVDSSTGVVTAVATSGVCSITATQTGNTSYYAAVPKTISFEISPPVITTAQSEIASGTYRTSYTEQLAATGGTGTYTDWAIIGTLPPGLSINTTTGEISGTPTAAGIYNFQVTTKSNGVTSAPKPYTITIAKVVVAVTAADVSVVYGSASPTVSPSYSGFVGGDSSTVLNSSPNIKPTCSSDYMVGDNAGTTTRTTSCSGAWSENYTFTYTPGTVTITKLAIEVTALNAVKQNLYSGTDPDVKPDPSFSGQFAVSPALPAGQTINNAIPGGVTLSRTTTVTTAGSSDPGVSITWPLGEAPGTYAITPTGVSSSSNYTITYVSGLLTIQTPKGVPQLTATDKIINLGSSSASALAVNVVNTCDPTTGVTTFSYNNNGTWETIVAADLANLGAGLYTIKARYVPDDTTDCYGRGSEVLEVSYQLTINKATATITAGTFEKWAGDPDPTFTWTVSGLGGSVTSSDIGMVSISRTSGEDPGDYTLAASGASHPNYNFNYNAGKLYIGKIIINTTDQGGVLTNRDVTLTCAGLKPGAAVDLKLSTPDVSLASGTVASNGTCPVSASIPTDKLGNFSLNAQSKFPTNVDIETTRPVSLVADPPVTTPNEPSAPSNPSDPLTPSSPSTRSTPSTPSTPSTVSPTPAPGPAPVVTPPSRGNNSQGRGPSVRPTPSPSPTTQDIARGPNRADPLAPPPLAVIPNLPAELARPSTIPGGTSAPVNPARVTVDTGAGIQPSQELQASGSSVGEASRQSGVRTLEELSSEKLAGFAPGAGLRIEILGARTGARFVVADLQVIDAVALLRAMEASITTQEADFSKITRVVRGEKPLIQEAWSSEVREGVDEFFAAVGLASPRELIDLDLSQVKNWVSVSAEVETYQPGSTVFLVATSSPIVLATAEVDRFGKAQLSGAMPVEALGTGEHRVRIVGIRSLDGVSVDSAGEIQLSQDLMNEIQRFDLGTQSTIALSGLNPEGGYHAAIRVVPLIPVAPWWTLWFILAGFVLALGARYRRLLETRSRGVIAASGVLASALPAVIIGWVSTVTNVVWVGILLGLIGAAVSWFMPEQKKSARRK
jgi:hypothetical protein